MACSCCGVPTAERRCLICRQICDGRHGDRLQAEITTWVARGRMNMWHALAASMLDDALLVGTLLVIPPAPGDTSGAMLWVPRPSERWRVVACRALRRGELVAIGEVVHAALMPYIGQKNTPIVREMLQHDLVLAMTFIDPDIVDIDVEVLRDAVDAENLQIVIKKRVNVEPGAVVTPAGASVEIPTDLLARTRAKA